MTLSGAERSESYGRPAVAVGGEAFVSTGREPGSFHRRSPHDEQAVPPGTDPATFCQTPHDPNWPGLLVRFGATDRERVRRVIARAWWDAARPRTRRVAGERR